MPLFGATPFHEKKRWFPLGILLSMRIAFLNLFRRSITIQYPKQRAHIPARARWAVEIKDHGSGVGECVHHCTACLICEKECPDFLIRLDVETREDRSKFIKHWYYDRGGCMMCGLCVEACPFDAIKMGHDYELAHAEKDLLILDLLTDTEAWKRPRPERPAKPAAPVAAATAATDAAAAGKEVADA